MEKAAVMPDAQLFRDVFTASPVGIAVENMEGQPLFVNPALCSMLGFAVEELQTKHCVDFSPVEDAEKDWSLFQQLRAGSIDHYQIDKRYFRRDGSLVWGRLNVSLLKTRPSPLVVAVVEDITEKRKAEEALLRLAAIVECSEDAIASVTLDGVIVSWNAGAQRMFGYTESEAVGRSATILVPPERPDEEDKILETLKAGGRIEQLETVRVTKTGKRINVSLSISPIKDSSGKTVGCSGIARDITERKLAEEVLSEMNRTLKEQSSLLRSREELLRVFVKNVPAAVAMFDCDMRYLEVSDRWCTTYSVDGSQILGRSHYDVFPDLPEVYKEVHRRGLAGETLRAEEDRWDRENGTTTWVRWELRPWKTATGTIGGILIFAEDITRRKQMEQALSSMSRKLIESQEQERSRIARELHDDVSQQLSLLAVELDQWDHSASDSSGLRHHLQQAKRRIADIAHDVQSLSHQLHSSKLEYLGLVAAARSFSKEVSEKNNVRVDFREHGVRRSLRKEVSLSLFRILQQAMQNAVEHSGAKNIEVRLWEHSNEVHLEVKDLGRGFDLPTALTSTGLGLISMRERARLVGGEITIDSKAMGGTTIHVRVPVDSESNSQRTAV
jgi:PAS domain S-box-containing protein